jgi:UDP-N-acetylglucosamine diphosphorylase/glucosamine-1-phosphate N-acetyltransferase
MQVVLFEDEELFRFLPLCYTRPVFFLPLCGRRISDWLLEELRAERAFAWVRSYLGQLALEKGGGTLSAAPEEGEALLLNGRVKPSLAPELVARLKPGSLLAHRSSVVAARLPARALRPLLEREPPVKGLLAALRGLGLEALELPASPLIEHLWELADASAELFSRRFPAEGRSVNEALYSLARVEGLYVEEGAQVSAPCYLDTSRGAIFIGRGARLEPFSVVQGPCYVGRGSIVHGAKLRPRSWIGDVVRLGGEVEESLVTGYSNKAHEGFLGHSVIGEWVNIGSGTQFSDLKNTYGTVRVAEGGERVDTGRQKVGAFIADDVKISIGTLIYAGVKIGVASHVEGLVDRDVPSFTFYMKGRAEELDLDKALEIRRRMMARRSLTLSRAEEAVLEKVYELTREERRRSPLFR